MDTKTFNYQFEEPTKQDLERELKKSYSAYNENRISLEKKIVRLQNELNELNQWIHLDKEEAKRHGIELD